MLLLLLMIEFVSTPQLRQELVGRFSLLRRLLFTRCVVTSNVDAAVAVVDVAVVAVAVVAVV